MLLQCIHQQAAEREEKFIVSVYIFKYKVEDLLGKSPNKCAFPYTRAMPNVCLYMEAANDSKGPAQHRGWDNVRNL